MIETTPFSQLLNLTKMIQKREMMKREHLMVQQEVFLQQHWDLTDTTGEARPLGISPGRYRARPRQPVASGEGAAGGVAAGGGTAGVASSPSATAAGAVSAQVVAAPAVPLQVKRPTNTERRGETKKGIDDTAVVVKVARAVSARCAPFSTGGSRSRPFEASS